MENFDSFNIPQWLKDSLKNMGYTTPTPIQQQSIPAILEGKDVLGTAQTGTGKTGAFLIPLLSYLEANPSETGLILTPTRELAIQVNTVAMQMLKTNPKVRTALLIGGDPIAKQFFQLKQKPRLIIGTPGRINDHLSRASVNLSKTSFVVLDETDRMLDMGFGIQIDEIFKYVATKKQTLLFSATMPKEILKLVDNYLVAPLKISAGVVNTVAPKVSQKIIKTKEKYAEILKLLPELHGTTLIFVRTQRGADSLRGHLRQLEFKADAIHGGLGQGKRTSVLRNFRAKKFNILVATDVASRGLDIDHIENVINYDIPDNPEDYIHRIGRTARGDKEGASYSFVSPAEEVKWRAVQKFLDPEAFKKDNSNDDSRWKPNRNNNSNRNKFARNKPHGGKHEGDTWQNGKPKSWSPRENNFNRDDKHKDKPFGERNRSHQGEHKKPSRGNREQVARRDENMANGALDKIKNLFAMNKRKENKKD
ncbi:MAG: DEAD/DEAH box helicase [Alphaproteobacteria bacterium]|jgi:superfamily II DNA/RNA helicase|nr:DEAD/DEAH box helicase [Alphaproteobacteria bacterium]